MLVDPRALDPCYVGELVLLSLALPDMVWIEAEMVCDGTYELGDVVRVKFHGIDSADGHSRPEQVRLVVLVHVDVRVESLAPSVLAVRSTLPLSKDGVRAKRVVCNPYVGTVSGHVELAVIRAYVRSDGNTLYIMQFPVEHVF